MVPISQMHTLRLHLRTESSGSRILAQGHPKPAAHPGLLYPGPAAPLTPCTSSAQNGLQPSTHTQRPRTPHTHSSTRKHTACSHTPFHPRVPEQALTPSYIESPLTCPATSSSPLHTPTPCPCSASETGHHARWTDTPLPLFPHCPLSIIPLELIHRLTPKTQLRLP